MNITAIITLTLGLALTGATAKANAPSTDYPDKETAKITESVVPESAKASGPAGQAAPPRIILLQPKAATITNGPINIELRFLAAAGSRIDVKSLRVLYGWLGIDVTERLLKHAEVNARGLIARHAELPPGHHKVTVEVQDNRNRVGRKTFRFEIPEPEGDGEP